MPVGNDPEGVAVEGVAVDPGTHTVYVTNIDFDGALPTGTVSVIESR